MDLIQKKILFLSQDETNRGSILTAFAQLMIGVTMVANAAEAFSILEKSPDFHGVFIDTATAVPDGFGFFRSIRTRNFVDMKLKPLPITNQNNATVKGYFRKQIFDFNNRLRQIPVLILTDGGNKDEILEARKLNASAYMIKPVAPDMLKQKIKAVISG